MKWFNTAKGFIAASEIVELIEPKRGEEQQWKGLLRSGAERLLKDSEDAIKWAISDIIPAAPGLKAYVVMLDPKKDTLSHEVYPIIGWLLAPAIWQTIEPITPEGVIIESSNALTLVEYPDGSFVTNDGQRFASLDAAELREALEKRLDELRAFAERAERNA